MSDLRSWSLAGAALAVCAAVVGVLWPDVIPEGEGSPSATPSATTPPPTGEPAEQLARLRVVERNPDGLPPYRRDAFGSAWADIDGNGCDQRDDVLLRDADPATVVVGRQRACDHDVLAGTWTDPYNGTVVTLDDLKNPSQAQAVQIDHIVALAEAWRSGAAEWTDDQRRLYANDLDNLVAAHGPTNAGKGSYDPASWRPKQQFQCEYATTWIAVKRRWDLAADASEVAALADMLATCATGPADLR
ncbi:MAG: HNH endonuclease family protein [Aeromicrobium sp.]|uniref:HNH endonuclease family protein n=1 Tax=Aeromicrobium sp. TaxID=1871063 RepID=UPI0039E3D066